LRKARLFRLNYALTGDPINFGELYGRKTDAETLAQANEILRTRMLELQALLRFYVKSRAKYKRALRRDFNNRNLKMSNIMYKYHLEFLQPIAEKPIENP